MREAASRCLLSGCVHFDFECTRLADADGVQAAVTGGDRPGFNATIGVVLLGMFIGMLGDVSRERLIQHGLTKVSTGGSAFRTRNPSRSAGTCEGTGMDAVTGALTGLCAYIFHPRYLFIVNKELKFQLWLSSHCSPDLLLA